MSILCTIATATVLNVRLSDAFIMSQLNVLHKLKTKVIN